MLRQVIYFALLLILLINYTSGSSTPVIANIDTDYIQMCHTIQWVTLKELPHHNCSDGDKRPILGSCTTYWQCTYLPSTGFLPPAEPIACPNNTHFEIEKKECLSEGISNDCMQFKCATLLPESIEEASDTNRTGRSGKYVNQPQQPGGSRPPNGEEHGQNYNEENHDYEKCTVPCPASGYYQLKNGKRVSCNSKELNCRDIVKEEDRKFGEKEQQGQEGQGQDKNYHKDEQGYKDDKHKHDDHDHNSCSKIDFGLLWSLKLIVLAFTLLKV